MPNSRPLSDRDVFLDYRDHEGLDEIAFETGVEFGRDGKPMFWPSGCVEINAAEIHHLWSKARRPDFKSNLVALSRGPHRLFHDGIGGQPVPIRLLCILAKMKKSQRLGDPSEFSIEDLDAAAGCSVRGWVEWARFEPNWDWCEPYRAELIARIDARNFGMWPGLTR